MKFLKNVEIFTEPEQKDLFREAGLETGPTAMIT